MGLDHVTARLARSDMAQLFTLFLAVLVIVLGFAWPTAGNLANESWFALAPSRNALLALVAAGFGASQGLIRVPGHQVDHAGVDQLQEAWSTLWALMLWVLLTLPFEITSHAASFPAINLAWSFLVSVLTVPAYFGLGLVLRKVLGVLRVHWLLPVAVPAVMVGLAWLDLQLNSALFNPWTAVLAPSPYPLVAGTAAAATLLALWRPWRHFGRGRARTTGGAPASGGGAR